VRLILLGPVIVLLLLVAAVMIYFVALGLMEDEPYDTYYYDEEDEGSDPLGYLIALPIIAAVVLFAMVRDAFSQKRLVVSDETMSFGKGRTYPRDRTVTLFVRPTGSMVLGPEGRLVGAPDGPATDALVFAMDREGGGTDWFEIPVRLRGPELSRTLDALRGALPNLLVSEGSRP